MRPHALYLAACVGALFAASTPAQVSVMPYGTPGLYQASIDPALFLQASLPTSYEIEVELVGGFADDPAAIVLAGMPAVLPLGNAASIYVAPPYLPIYGTFDPTGRFAVRFPYNEPAFAGVTLYMQGVDVMLEAGGMQLSNGLMATFPL